MTKENQIKTSPSLDLKNGELSLRKDRGMGATVANKVYTYAGESGKFKLCAFK